SFLQPEFMLDWPVLPLLVGLLMRIFYGLYPLSLFIWAVLWLPLAVFPLLLLAWTAQRRWLRVGVLIGLSLLISLAWVSWLLSIPLSSRDPLQHYSWDGWYMSWFVGAYGAGALTLAALLFRPIVRWLGRGLREVLPRFRSA